MLLRNLPESWRPISQTIHMIVYTRDDIKEGLEAHKANLNALEVSNAATAFSARARPMLPNFFGTQPKHQGPQSSTSKPAFHCNNCGKPSDPASKCYAPSLSSTTLRCQASGYQALQNSALPFLDYSET